MIKKIRINELPCEFIHLTIVIQRVLNYILLSLMFYAPGICQTKIPTVLKVCLLACFTLKCLILKVNGKISKAVMVNGSLNNNWLSLSLAESPYWTRLLFQRFRYRRIIGAAQPGVSSSGWFTVWWWSAILLINRAE